MSLLRASLMRRFPCKKPLTSNCALLKYKSAQIKRFGFKRRYSQSLEKLLKDANVNVKFINPDGDNHTQTWSKILGICLLLVVPVYFTKEHLSNKSYDVALLTGEILDLQRELSSLNAKVYSLKMKLARKLRGEDDEEGLTPKPGTSIAQKAVDHEAMLLEYTQMIAETEVKLEKQFKVLERVIQYSNQHSFFMNKESKGWQIFRNALQANNDTIKESVYIALNHLLHFKLYPFEEQDQVSAEISKGTTVSASITTKNPFERQQQQNMIKLLGNSSTSPQTQYQKQIQTCCECIIGNGLLGPTFSSIMSTASTSLREQAVQFLTTFSAYDVTHEHLLHWIGTLQALAESRTAEAKYITALIITRLYNDPNLTKQLATATYLPFIVILRNLFNEQELKLNKAKISGPSLLKSDALSHYERETRTLASIGILFSQNNITLARQLFNKYQKEKERKDSTSYHFAFMLPYAWTLLRYSLAKDTSKKSQAVGFLLTLLCSAVSGFSYSMIPFLKQMSPKQSTLLSSNQQETTAFQSFVQQYQEVSVAWLLFLMQALMLLGGGKYFVGPTVMQPLLSQVFPLYGVPFDGGLTNPEVLKLKILSLQKN